MSPARPPPPWLFVLTGMPYGVAASFASTVMPYLARRAGLEIDAIGWYGALLLVPPMLQFLYAPIVDLGPRRKHWLVIVSVLSAACLVAACVMPLPDRIAGFLAFAVAGQLISGLVGSCNGGLLAAAMPDHLRGRASAAFNIGNLSGGGLAAWVAIELTRAEVDPLIIGLALGAMMVAPSLAALAIDEPARDPATSTGAFRRTFRDLAHILTRRQGLTGVLLCASPVGTAALANYFSAMAADYGATDRTIAFVSGPANVVLTALGALIGGFLCDRYNRRVLYLSSGTLTALCAIWMALSPRAPETYVFGVMTYALITGFCYAAFTATVLETIGETTEAGATQYSLFTAAGNAAIAYVGLVDTRFHEAHGVEGVVASDATLNLVGVAILALVFWRLGAFGRWRHGPAGSAARG